MRLRQRDRAVSLVSGICLVLILSAVALLAIIQPGAVVRKLELNDSGIWLTNDSLSSFGRFNKSANAFDAGFQSSEAAATSLDVWQDGPSVVVRDGGRLVPVDVRTGLRLEPAQAGVDLAPSSMLAMGGGTIARFDAASGRFWATRYTGDGSPPSLSALDSAAPPLADLGAAPQVAVPEKVAAVAVSSGGVAHAVTAGGRMLRLAPTDAGFAAPEITTLPVPVGEAQLTTVGEIAVLLDVTDGTLRFDGRVVRLPEVDPSARLQQSSPARASIVVATSSALLAFPLDGGPARAIAALPTTEADRRGASGRTDANPAAPVQLGACAVGAWPGAPGLVARWCGGDAVQIQPFGGVALLRPVIRVNRDRLLVVGSNGVAFDPETKARVDNWKAINRPPTATRQDDDSRDGDLAVLRRKKPQARPDVVGARPGATAVLHVLDNDSDPAGRILAASPVNQPSGEDAEVVAAPDGQTLLYRLARGGGDRSFTYKIDNGEGGSDTTTVTVEARRPEQNKAPRQLPLAVAQQRTVVAGQTLSLSALSNWRDDDGDPLTLVGAEADRGTVSVAGDQIEYTAADRGGRVRVRYQVSDGYPGAAPEAGEIVVTVLDTDDTSQRAPVAQADLVTGISGRPIVFSPLANDIPGADPSEPDARLALAGKVSPADGAEVETDLASGKVTVTAAKPGVYLFGYAATYGSSDLSGPGRIRVDVRRSPDEPEPPVAVPDDATVHGQNAVVVDVLANDVDPAGGVLTVESAAAADADQLQVSVLRGRWLRVQPTRLFSTGRQTLHYRVTNGFSRSEEVQVTVTALPPPELDPPVTRDDRAVVRSGDSVLIPVLENDTTVGGSALSLRTDVAESPGAGRLTVVDLTSRRPGQDPGDLGQAYVSNGWLRYVAPRTVTAATAVSIDYVAQNELGETATGTAYVTINPDDAENNRVPSPEPIEARVVSGSTMVVPIPASGQDPDGDAVSVLRLGTAPRLGRVTGLTPTGFTYQAYPTSAGTDDVDVVVADRYGATATATVRISVTQPAAPASVTAVPDAVTAAPGARVQLALLANDLYERGSRVTVSGVGLMPPGTTVDAGSGTLVTRAPDSVDDTLRIAYDVRVGTGAVSKGTATIRAQEDYNNPPVVTDQVATIAAGSTTAEADVLAAAHDPDGEQAELTVQLPLGTAAQVDGSVVRIPVTGSPQTIAYEVTDSAGGAAAAVIHVPGAGSGPPFARPGATITLGTDQSVEVALADYVLSPRGLPVTLTGGSTRSTSPSDKLSFAAVDNATVRLTGRGGYSGPAAVTVEVTDGDPTAGPGASAVITIPVQVGPVTPVLRCPHEPLDLVQGGLPLDLDIASLCHVWLPDAAGARALTYTGEWRQPLSGLNVTGVGGARLSVAADSATRPGEAELTVAVTDMAAASDTLRFRVRTPARPELATIRLPELRQGGTAELDLAAYLTSPLREPAYTIVRLVPSPEENGSRVTVDGGKATIGVSDEASGLLTFTLRAADLPDRADREVVSTVTLPVYGVPDQPRGVAADATGQSRTATVSWRAGGDNGAPILGYRVRSSRGDERLCSASPCQIRGLTNDVSYRFTVQARNKAGWGPVSEVSGTARPDAKPPAVAGLAASRPRDHALTLTWTAPVPDGSPVTRYRITWPGSGAGRTTDQTTFSPTGLNNDTVYTFTVRARNRAGWGEATRIEGQSSGRPQAPTGVRAVGESDVSGADTPVRITWNAVSANGPDPVTYRVIRTGGSETVICDAARRTSCVDSRVDYDGTRYTYRVTATNKTGGPAHTSRTGRATFDAVGRPDSWRVWDAEATGSTGQVRLRFDVPDARGREASLSLYDGSNRLQALSTSATSVSLANGRRYDLKLRLCNEADNCSDSDVVGVTPYGPVSISVRDLGSSGPRASYRVTVEPNGLPVRVRVDGQEFTTGGSAPESRDFDKQLGYDASDQVTARTSAVDGDDRRQEVSDSVTLRTRGRPSLAVAKGAPGRASYCDTPPCARIVVTGRNFAPDARLTVFFNTDCQASRPAWAADCRGDSPTGTTHYTSVSYATDSNGSFSDDSRFFGYPDAAVWVDADAFGEHFESNRVTW